MMGINKSMRKITYYENILEYKENTKEELNLNEINNWKLCRTCLMDIDENDVNINNMSIMDVMRGTILNIEDMLVEIGRIKISKTENLPLQVCNECFSKITELYYFSIQIRKAEKVLNRLAKTFKDHNPIHEADEVNTEVEDDQDTGSVSEIATISIDEGETVRDEPSEANLKETAELFEEMFDTETVLEDNETSVFSSEIGTLFKDQQPPLLSTTTANPAEPKITSSDEESNLENNLIEYLETYDADNCGPSSNSTAEINESVPYKSKKTKAKPKKKRTASATTGFRHKQPRVTSPLLDDFDCAICQISYGRQQDLVQHVRDSHPNSKAYKCRVCGNLFSHIQSLSRHMNNHKESVVLNECAQCSKLFMRVDDLKRHSRVHTGERPYVCSICEKSFQQQSDLKCHQRRHAYADKNLPPRIHECPLCEKGYTSRTGLNWHKKKYHKQESQSHTSESDAKRHSVIHLQSVSNKSAGSSDKGSSAKEEENGENLTIVDENSR